MEKKGFALALTLWIVAIMSLVTALYLTYGQKIVNKTIQLNKKLEITLEAESIVEVLKFYGATGYFYKNKVINVKLQKVFNTLPTQLYIDSRINYWKNSKIILEDSSSLININDKEAFVKYLSFENNNIKDNKGIIQDSMKDWLDVDEFSSLNGAEALFYKNQKKAYTSRNEEYFSSVEEVFLLRGLNNYSIDKQRELQKKLILLDYSSRNILTMDMNTLFKVYQLSISELEQLKEAKKESLNSFLTLFNSFNKGNENYELDGFIPSNILRITVKSTLDNISKNITLLVSFKVNKENSFQVLEYND